MGKMTIFEKNFFSTRQKIQNFLFFLKLIKRHENVINRYKMGKMTIFQKKFFLDATKNTKFLIFLKTPKNT